MKVFVAGASGAIGLPLVSALIRQGHAVTGMTRSELGAERLLAMGARVARVSAFDAAGLEETLRKAEPEVVIDELTALPKGPAEGVRRSLSRGSAAAARNSAVPPTPRPGRP